MKTEELAEVWGGGIERGKGTVHRVNVHLPFLLTLEYLFTFGTSGTPDLPAPRTLTENGLGVGEQERRGAGEGFGGGQPGLCGKVFSTG